MSDYTINYDNNTGKWDYDLNKYVYYNPQLDMFYLSKEKGPYYSILGDVPIEKDYKTLHIDSEDGYGYKTQEIEFLYEYIGEF